jgi:hypothetical protein
MYGCEESTTPLRPTTAFEYWWTGSGHEESARCGPPSMTGCSAVAPSDALRKWYGHAPDRFDEFRTRYRDELREPERAAALRHVRALTSGTPLTLLTATKQVEISQAQVIAELLRA